ELDALLANRTALYAQLSAKREALLSRAKMHRLAPDDAAFAALDARLGVPTAWRAALRDGVPRLASLANPEFLHVWWLGGRDVAASHVRTRAVREHGVGARTPL